ncbi:MAG: hypothetical protein KF889_25420 [Alphaproteobacteria bacterium]|nr:hypothetical protein [Alphaproteobacteria bacterium]MCW5739666.1 hypothetical protein [Alphaproteobacteria bacterium]
MIFDKENLFSNDQAITDSAASTDYIDLGVSRDIGVGEPMEVFLGVTTAMLSGGSSTLAVALQTDTQSSFATAVTLQSISGVAKASLVAGYEIAKWKLPAGVQRYLRLYYTPGTTDFTAGAVRAGLLRDRQAQAHYASGLLTTGF